MWSAFLQAGIGDFDASYGDHGVLINRGAPTTMAVTPDGRVVTAVTGDDGINIYMFNTQGHPDVTFGPDGHFALSQGTTFNGAGVTVAAASSDNLYFALTTGSQTAAQLVRVTSAGALDAGFGLNGVATFPNPELSASGSHATILSIAPMARGQVAVLVGYFNSIYDCADDLRMFRLTYSGAIEIEYDHAAMQAALGACSEFGGLTLQPIGNGYAALESENGLTVFDPAGRVVSLDLGRAGVAAFGVNLSPRIADNYVFVSGPSATLYAPYTCVISLLLPDLSHTGINGDGDDWTVVDFGTVPKAPGRVRSCKVLAGPETGFVYVEALMVSDEGRTLVAIARLRVGGVYYPDLDRSFGNGGIAVVGMEAAFALFSEQADGSLMLSHGAYAGGPLQGGDAVIKLLGTNLPSPGLIFLEAPPIPVPVVQGTPVIVSARRALGSSGAMTVSYAVTAQSNGPPISFSLVRDVTLTWGDGEQGSRSAEAATAQGAVGHYYVDAKSAPETAFFDNKGSFEVVLSSPSSTGNPGSGSPIGGASGANGTQSAGGAPRSGGGSLDRNLLMFLACLLLWQRVSSSARYNRSRNR